MSYFGFLLRFLVIPLLILAVLLWQARSRAWPANLSNFSVRAVVLLHVIIALVYTTPWDNYLVATRVWWYDPALVTGVTLGWVPIEEYTFFVLQTLLTSAWLLWLAPRLERAVIWQPSRSTRFAATGLALLLWLPTPFLLTAGPAPSTYTALILVWAIPPIALQLAFGADILWRYRALVVAAILGPTLYLVVADTLAIRAGTWAINPDQTLGVHFPGGLPFEEAVFFLVTNVLIVFGVILALAEESYVRLKPWLPTRVLRLLSGSDRTSSL